jgi:hypothetical protein
VTAVAYRDCPPGERNAALDAVIADVEAVLAGWPASEIDDLTAAHSLFRAGARAVHLVDR